jgi:hypothetical protein
MPSVCEGLLQSLARGLLELFQRKGLLPRTLKFSAALGDLDGVRAALNENGNDLKTVNDAFVCACRFAHEAVASLLLERSISLDPELGEHIDGHTDRLSFIRCFKRPDRSDFAQVAALGLWKVFDSTGVVRNLDDQYPYNDPHARSHLSWNPPTAQQVLDVALAFAVINRHFDVADFLLEHGADINTDWNSHEPASILHHLVFLPNSHESMRFLVDRGIDLTIRDYRWDATAEGWARVAAKDAKMAQWLEEAERQREKGR